MTTLAAALFVVFPQLELPGTQPNELTTNLQNPSSCITCHADYAEYAAMDTWAGSMMANAARDPLYLAALTVANQDVPGVGELCIKCHSPRGWLGGRGIPTDQSALTPADYEGVQCDFCHRLVPGPGGERFIGNAHFYVADDIVQRSTLQDAQAPHQTAFSDYHLSSELCGACHDVSNPLLNNFAIERTYTEWKNSAFSVENKTCQACHMVRMDNAVNSNAPGAPVRQVGVHDLVGGNTFIPQILAGEYPELGRAEAFAYTIAKAREMLQSSAELELTFGDGRTNENGVPLLSVGKKNELWVRVENLGGHKLPTGYPEGRRSWLEVKVEDAAGNIIYHSGAYDLATATRIDDPDIRTYEVRLASGGVEGFHFVLTDQILQDNRIPPRGFRPTPETQPIGRDYPVLDDGSLAHWDDALYDVAIPDLPPGTAGTVTVTLWYQTASREYIEFLRDENHTDNRGQEMYDFWQRYGQGAPEAMATVRIPIEFAEPASGACGCAVRGPGKNPLTHAWPALLGLLALLTLRVRRRRALS